MRALGRVLTPLGWGAVALVLAGIVLALAFDPLGWRARKIERLERAAANGEQLRKIRDLEAVENERIEKLRALSAQEKETLARQTAVYRGEAANDPTGQVSVGVDRLDRLLQHDRLVCQRASTGACDAAASDPF